MVGLNIIEESNIHIGDVIAEFVGASSIRKGDLSSQMGISRNTLNNLLGSASWPDQTILDCINSLNTLTPDSRLLSALKLFPVAIPAFLEVGLSHSNGIVGRTLKIGLKEVFESVVSNHPFSSHLIVNGSLGQGNAAHSIWLGVRDNRISEKNFEEGVYVVLLFDTTGEYAYLSIAYAVKDKSKKQLESLTHAPAEKIMQAVANDTRYQEIKKGAIDLKAPSSKSSASYYEESVIVSKKYVTREMNETQLADDLSLMISLFYDFVFDEYFETLEQSLFEDSEIPDKNDASETKGQSRSTINAKRHREILEARAKHNQEIGQKAEEFVYNSEIQKLKDKSYHEYVHLVKHVAKEKDGHGYDIESIKFDGNGNIKFDEYGNTIPVYLEVKGSSMGGGDTFNFYLSERELTVAKEKRDAYSLVLVEYVGYEKMNMFERVTPFPSSGEQAIEYRPIQYKCSLSREL